MAYALDPELAAVLPMLPTTGIADVPAARAGFAAMVAAMPAPDATGVDIEDRLGPGPEGAPQVPVRVYRPQRPAGPAGVYDVHGGGFVMGDLEVGRARNVALARELGVVVVSVDYRAAETVAVLRRALDP